MATPYEGCHLQRTTRICREEDPRAGQGSHALLHPGDENIQLDRGQAITWRRTPVGLQSGRRIRIISADFPPDQKFSQLDGSFGIFSDHRIESVEARAPTVSRPGPGPPTGPRCRRWSGPRERSDLDQGTEVRIHKRHAQPLVPEFPGEAELKGTGSGTTPSPVIAYPSLPGSSRYPAGPHHCRPPPVRILRFPRFRHVRVPRNTRGHE